MPLLKNNAFVENSWVLLPDDQPAQAGSAIVVSFNRLRTEWDTLAAHAGTLGVVIANTTDIDELAPYLSRLALIQLPFPAFTDGRSYSLARQLRQQGYSGELRATGGILPDQLPLMQQVGVDSFEVSDRFPLEAWQKAASLITYSYQRGLRGAAIEHEVWSSRHHGFEPWNEQPHAG